MPLVKAGQTIGPAEIELLRSEHAAILAQLTTGPMLARDRWPCWACTCARTRFVVFIYYRDPRIVDLTLDRLATCICLVVITMPLIV